MVTDDFKEAIAPGYIHNSKNQIYMSIYFNRLVYGFFNYFRGK